MFASRHAVPISTRVDESGSWWKGMYMPPLLEALGLAEVEHNPKNNRVRAL